MKYLYYIAGILILFSAWVMYALFNDKVEISYPALVINDQVITRTELKKLLESQSYRGTEHENMDQLITRQLLIQEAVRQKINKEESFRSAVQSYYEQSLVKILLDRQNTEINVNVTKDEIKKYKSFSNARVVILSQVYQNEEDALKRDSLIEEDKIIENFADLPDYLRFMVFSLGKGGISAPLVFETGVWVYEVQDISPMDEQLSMSQLSDKEITLFLRDQKTQKALNSWIQQLRDKAEIWRENES